jgi:hypothetical protein
MSRVMYCCWKTSLGSIYPVLVWLQDRGYIKEAFDVRGLLMMFLFEVRKGEIVGEQKGNDGCGNSCC